MSLKGDNYTLLCRSLWTYQIYFIIKERQDRRGRDRMVVGNTTTYAISAITTDVVSSNLDQGDVYNII